MSYLQKPLSVNQSNHLLKFMEIVFDLGLITEDTFADTAHTFDDFVWEYRRLSWEPVPKEWWDEHPV